MRSTEKNEFNFIPIKEVAILFAGIFCDHDPGAGLARDECGQIAVGHPGEFYFGRDSLSSVLDNAPTYLSFLSAQIGLLVSPDLVREVQGLIQSQAGALGSPVRMRPEVKATYLTLVRYHTRTVAGRHRDRPRDR